jgi:AAA15 family ATPase/GTPase
MEIRFIWARNYRVIENLGVNFNNSGDHHFSYEGTELKLSARTKNKLTFGSKVTSLTVIAGENGIGKSSLCELVLATTATNSKNVLHAKQYFEGIVVYENYIFHQENIPITNGSELEAEEYQLIRYKNSPLEDFLNDNQRQEIIRNRFIYYSNAFDPRSDFDEVNLNNISSQASLTNAYKYSTAYPAFRLYPSPGTDHYDGRVRFRDSHLYSMWDNYRYLKFFLKYPECVPFRQPQQFLIKSSFSANNKWLRRDEDRSAGWADFQNEILQMEEEIFNRVIPQNTIFERENLFEIDIPLLKEAIHQLYRLNIVMVLAIAPGLPRDIEIIRRFVFEREAIGFEQIQYWQIAFGLIELHWSIVEQAETLTGPIDLSAFSTRERVSWDDYRFYLLEYLYLDNTPNNTQILHRFLTLEMDLLNRNTERERTRRITNYDFFPHLSAGQTSFMSFFARFSDHIDNLDAGPNVGNNLILFIDEGDTGFHPAWKKKFLHWLLSFIEENIQDFTFQIILTTHSPYLLSDVNSDNVILLHKGHRGNTEIVSVEQFETFGANIHELLANSFFLKDGSIGEYAKKRIQSVIDKLNLWRDRRREMSSEMLINVVGVEKQEVFEFISIIGDKIVKGKLLEMYLEVFGDNNSIEQEIRNLEARINNLRNRIQ